MKTLELKLVVVWLKIRINDIKETLYLSSIAVVVWLKIRINDINIFLQGAFEYVVVWLKIRKNDIFFCVVLLRNLLWFD